MYSLFIVFSNREELVKIIGQLKSGEEITSSVVSNNNEDSSSTEIPPQAQVASVRIKIFLLCLHYI